MKRIAIIIAIVAIALEVSSQAIVGTPKSMYLIYNNPGNYFYLKIDGEDKRNTEISNMYYVDGKTVQIITVKKSDFIPDSLPAIKTGKVLERYFAFEKEYIDTMFRNQVEYTSEYAVTHNKREYLFWTFHPLVRLNTSENDSTSEVIAERQLYVATEVGPDIVAASTSFYKDENNFDELKRFLLDIIASIVVSTRRIDVYELNKQVNTE